MAYLIPDNLRSRRDVPAGASLVARLLGDALHDGATVWYEPLFDVDGDRPDLIVLIPDTGVLVIEVLQQKAAAVVGVADGDLCITEQGKRHTLSDPLSRAQRFADDLAARMRTAGIGPTDELPVSALGVFAYIDQDTADAKGISAVVDAGRCLFRDDLDHINGDLAGARQAIAGAMAAPLREVISEDAERLYRAVIHPDTVLAPVQMALPAMDVTPSLDVKALDRDQENLAKSLGGGHRVIRGVAGSGKTVILIHRARLLAQLNRRHRILVTCYNVALHGWIERQLRPYANVQVRTMHSQMNKVLDITGAPRADFDKEDLEDSATRAVDVLAELGNRAHSQLFDHVLVDEAQDFGPNALRFATKLLRDGSDSLLVVADAAQSLYRKGFTWKEAGIEAQGRTKVLTRNYRNTKQILERAWFFLSRGNSIALGSGSEGDSDVIVAPEAALRQGPWPYFAHCESPDAEVLQIAEEVGTWLAAGESPGDIAVLYGSRWTLNFPWVDKLRQRFDQEGIPWYWPTDSERPTKHLVGDRDDAVMICTIHSAKGLEFKNVILCAYLEDRPPEELETKRRLLYVGMTRAKERLVLTASGNHPYIADLEGGNSRS